LTGIRFSHEDAKQGRYTPIEFETTQRVLVLIGYFQADGDAWLHPPNLETNANADERGGVEPVLLNAAQIAEYPAVNIHALKYDAGKNKLDVSPSGRGCFVVLGIVPQSATIAKRDARRPAGMAETATRPATGPDQ
jgi:hypothetical protein